jgi:2-dehydropantoate 2-reductase
MTYTIVGAGAIGGTIGAYMVRGGKDVLFVDADAAHVSAINQHGLTIQGYAETFTVRARAITPDQLPNGLERVILATKAPATGAAIAHIKPHLAAQGYVVSAQNGLNEIEISQEIGANRTIGCFVNFSADYLSPGLIHFGGPGAFFIGELDGKLTPRLAELQTALSHWGGGQVRTTENIWGYLWGKLGYGAMLFATALTNESMGDAIDTYRSVLVALAREVIATATAEGVKSIGFDGYDPDLYRQGNATALNASIDQLVAIRRRDKKTHSGVWRDLAVRKRKTEVDAQYRPILERAKVRGVAVPLLTRLVSMMHEIEDGKRPLCKANLDELTEHDLTNNVSKEHLWRTNSAIAKHIRLSGTPEERQAFEFCKAEFDSYGFRTQMLEHPALVSWPLSTRLEVTNALNTRAIEIECLGTAHSASATQLSAEIADMGDANDNVYAKSDVRGKVVLINGLATPGAVMAAERAGAVGQIFINDAHLHNMIVSPVWGTPTPETAGFLPKTPSVSVREQDGLVLRTLIASGVTQVTLSTHILREWKTTPILVADLDAPNGNDDFVLFSGHLDSWEYGAMDNGSANSTMLEVGRLIASNQRLMRRGLRLIMWSGHSHGRYSGSTWYVDNHWEQIYDHCVVHVNVDSTGARGATYYGSFPAHLEISAFGAERIKQYTGQEAHAHRMVRAGDMSFNGVGIPSLFMSLSQVPFAGEQDYVSQAQGKLFGGKMPYWWHTVDDTLDKVDLDVLALDTQVYVSTLWRLVRAAILPMNFCPVAEDIIQALDALQTATQGHFDFGTLRHRAQVFAQYAAQLADECDALSRGDADEAVAMALNRKLIAVSRAINPITYTRAGQFDHDLALGEPYLPTLIAAKQLASLPPTGDDYQFLRTRIQRNANAVAWALRNSVA